MTTARTTTALAAAIAAAIALGGCSLSLPQGPGASASATPSEKATPKPSATTPREDSASAKESEASEPTTTKEPVRKPRQRGSLPEIERDPSVARPLGAGGVYDFTQGNIRLMGTERAPSVSVIPPSDLLDLSAQDGVVSAVTSAWITGIALADQGEALDVPPTCAATVELAYAIEPGDLGKDTAAVAARLVGPGALPIEEMGADPTTAAPGAYYSADLSEITLVSGCTADNRLRQPTDDNTAALILPGTEVEPERQSETKETKSEAAAAQRAAAKAAAGPFASLSLSFYPNGDVSVRTSDVANYRLDYDRSWVACEAIDDSRIEPTAVDSCD